MLDIGAQHGIQAVARRHIDVNAELVLEQKLDPDEFEEGELSLRVVVDEQIEIALLLRLVACDGAEQIERRGAQCLDGFGVAFEPGNGLAFVHRRNIQNLAQEEYAKAFLLYCVREEIIPWDDDLHRVMRNHACKHLVTIVMEYVDPE